MHSKHLQDYLLVDNLQYLGITGVYWDLELLVRVQSWVHSKDTVFNNNLQSNLKVLGIWVGRSSCIWDIIHLNVVPFAV